MIGLAPHTGKIIDAVAQLDCIRPYWLVGGTALSLQLHTRLYSWFLASGSNICYVLAYKSVGGGVNDQTP